MTTKISSDNIQAATLATIGSGPKITQVLVCDSSYNELDDTAVDIAGGYIKIIGSGFKTGATVTINRQPATSVTFVSATELRAQVPAEVAGTYVVYVVNSDGGVALRVNGVTFSSLPAWTTDSTLPTGDSGALISIQLVAAQATQYTLAQGSTLPPDLTLSNSGLLSGTVSISTETTYNFQVVATDAELQDSPRSFSITITVGDPFFTSVTALLNTSGTNGAQNNTFIDSSTNNFTITRNGNTAQGSFSPFGENWSNYFDGTGDFLQVASNAAFGFGTGDFTVEFWVFPLAGTRQDWIDITNGTQRALLYYSGTAITFYSVPPNAAVITGPAITLNAWAHIAVSKQAGNTRLFVNGTQVGSTYTTSQNYGTAGSVTIGKDSAGSTVITGYMSNVRIVKGTALYTANFTPSTVPLQPVAGTSLLTCKDPNIVDDSPNQFTITRNGDVSVQKFGPFAGTTLTTPYYGAYFDGTGDYLTTAGSSLLSTNFTIEFWVAFNTFTSPGSNYQNLFGTNNSFNSAGNILFLANYNGSSYTAGAMVIFNQDNNRITLPGGTFVLGRWQHVALVRQNGTSLKIYVDGVQAGSATIGAGDQYGASGVGYIIASQSGALSRTLNGHISNLRVVDNQALYTSDFTPSTAPLTTTSQGATASNVSLLTCQSSTFIDNSTNNFAITAVGNSRPTTFAPFAVTYSLPQSYTPEVFGGSGYFDGTGDWLTVASPTSALNTGTTYTIEAYVYPTILNTTNMVFTYANNNVSSFGGWLLWFNASGTIYFECRPSTGGANVQVIGGTVLRNSWSHIAVSVSSNAVKLFLNGVQVQTGTVAAVDGTQNNMAIGALTNGAPAGPFNGYISGARLVVGTALYASSFVPQNAPLTPITNTRLLINATNAGIYDASTLNDFETVGNAQVSTSVKKYGTSSMAFDGSGDSLDVKPLALPFFGQRGAYTIEAWIYPTNLSVAQYFYSQVTTNFLQFAISSSGFLQVDRSGVGVAITSSSALTINTWQYVTLVSDGTNLRLYINGTQSGSTVSVGTQVNPSSAIIRIGAYQNSGGAPTFPFYGYIQDLRITQGIARYTENFTPPTAPLQTR